MTDLVDLDRIRATLNCPDVQQPLLTSEEALEKMVESTAKRFFNAIDSVGLKKPVFVGHFEASEPLHEAARLQLLDGARWLTEHEHSNCVVFKEPRRYDHLQERPSYGAVADLSGLLVSGVDGNQLVERVLVRDGMVQAHTYFVYPPDRLKDTSTS
jgi:hypothetical protein